MRKRLERADIDDLNQCLGRWTWPLKTFLHANPFKSLDLARGLIRCRRSQWPKAVVHDATSIPSMTSLADWKRDQGTRTESSQGFAAA